MTRQFYIPATKYGVCVWEDNEGRILADKDNNYLSMEGMVNDPRVEIKMRDAARYWMGSEFEGQPKWIYDARKISDGEYEDQMARLLDGKIPDPIDEVRQIQEKK